MVNDADHRLMTGEHWRQWIATLGPMIVFALGIGFWVVSGFSQTHEDITSVKADVREQILSVRSDLVKVIGDTKSESNKGIADLMQKLSTDEGRINALERSLSEMKSDEATNRTEVHNSLSAIFSAVSDMRVSLAKQGDGKSR